MFSSESDLTIDGDLLIYSDPKMSTLKRSFDSYSEFKMIHLLGKDSRFSLSDISHKLLNPGKMVFDLSNMHLINPTICDRCGIDLNILNKVHTLCKQCDELLDNEYQNHFDKDTLINLTRYL